MSSYVPPLIAGVLKELPNPGEPLSVRRRAQWLKTFGAILELLYPETGEPASFCDHGINKDFECPSCNGTTLGESVE